MAFTIKRVLDNRAEGAFNQEIHIVGEDNTFRDEDKILQIWGDILKGRNAHLLIEVGDDMELILKVFSKKVVPPALGRTIWACKLITNSDLLKDIDVVQERWMPIKRKNKKVVAELNEVDKYCKAMTKAKKAKKTERYKKAEAEMKKHQMAFVDLINEGYGEEGLFVILLEGGVGKRHNFAVFDFITNSCLRDNIRAEAEAGKNIKAGEDIPEEVKKELSEKVEREFASRSSIAQRCAVTKLIESLPELTKDPVSDGELREIAMDFAEALDAQTMDDEFANR